MKHINFIEKKPMFRFKQVELKIDYFWLIFIAAGLFTLGLTVHLVLNNKISSYQEQFVAMKKLEEKPVSVPVPVPVPVKIVTPIVGVGWSDWLKKYSTEFPRYIHMKKISGNRKDDAKIILEATGQTASDASRVKRNLIKTGLCKEVELKTVNQTDEIVEFELECKLL